MEYQKIRNILGNAFEKVPKWSTKKCAEVHHQTAKSHSTSKQIRFKTSMLRSNLYDYSDACIIVKEAITIDGTNELAYDKKLTLRNNASFINCIWKINNTLINSAEGLDIVMPVYNLIEYGKNSSKTLGILWNYCRDEPMCTIL